MRDLVTKLVAEKLSAKTVGELISTTKQIVASAVDANGNYLCPRQWNAKFTNMPQVQNQAQPCATRADVDRCIKNSRNDQERLLYAVLAGSGLRIAEALTIHVGGSMDQTVWDRDSSTISVKSSMYRGKEHNRVKTLAAVRTVDLDPRLNELIAEFVVTNNIQTGQLLFQSRTGHAMNLKAATDRLKKHGVKGFHAFRHFRITRLRERSILEDLVRFWAGHSCETISDRYSKLAENVELRKKCAGSDEAGLGFDIRLAGTPGHPAPEKLKLPKRAKPSTRTIDIVTLIPSEPAYPADNQDLHEFFFAPVAKQV